MMCSICGEPFQRGDVIVAFRVWPSEERVGHTACVVSLSIENNQDEDDDRRLERRMLG
jgi:hypothetical protein